MKDTQHRLRRVFRMQPDYGTRFLSRLVADGFDALALR